MSDLKNGKMQALSLDDLDQVSGGCSAASPQRSTLTFGEGENLDLERVNSVLNSMLRLGKEDLVNKLPRNSWKLEGNNRVTTRQVHIELINTGDGWDIVE